jgi:hypothetical protein
MIPKNVVGSRDTDPELTAREVQIAKLAANIAVEQMTNSFYQEVGRTVVNRFLILLGAMAIAFAFGKGWIKW